MKAVRLSALSLVFILILSVGSAPVISGQESGNTLTLPTSIDINSDDSIDEFEEYGVVSADVGTVQMEITIAESREQVGLGYTTNPLRGTIRNDFVSISYREPIDRTVKIPIHGSYWDPYPTERLESLDGNHVARFEVIKDNGTEYQLMTIKFEGTDTAIFPIPADAVAAFRSAESAEKRVKKSFGINLGLTPTAWNQIDPDVFAGNRSTVRLEGNPDVMLVQYNAGTPEEPVWLSVPRSESRTVPLYRIRKDGVSNAVYVVSTSTDTPSVRWKESSTLGDRISESIRGARFLPRRIGSLFNGGGVEIDIPTGD